MALFDCLRKDGWYLNAAALEEYFAGKDNVDDIKKASLDLDLKLIGQSHITETTWKSKSDCVNGPLVLQLQKARNVCMPKSLEDSAVKSSGSQLLRLTLTDGQQTMCALEMDGQTGLGLNTPPGSKLKLLGKVAICNGYLLLYKANCKLLGGRVHNMVESWNLKRSLAAHSRDAARSDVAGGPPPFIPFGQRGKVDNASKRVHFKSLDAGDKRKEFDTEFEQQRKAVIEAAVQQQTQSARSTTNTPAVKQLSDKNIATIVEMGFSVQQATAALNHSGGNLDVALNSLLPSDHQNAASNGQPAHGDREARTTSSNVTLNGPTHRSDRNSDSSHSDRSGGRRGQRRTGSSQQDDNEYSSSRPSAPATLFDFVTSKMPLSYASAADVEASSSPSDGTKSISQSAAQRANSSSSLPQNNLPPRLQKKQRQAEEENYMKYYKPMDYMRQTNSYHKKVSADNGSSRGVDNARPHGGGSGHRIRDVNSRGSVTSRKLWTDDAMSASNGRSSTSENASGDGLSTKINFSQSNVEDARLSDSAAGERKPPVTVLTSSSNKLVSVEAGIASMNIQSTASSHTMSQPSYVGPGSMGTVNDGKRWHVGDVCMAKYWQDNEYYKARIESVASGGAGKKHITVFFTDYGNREVVSFDDIRELPDQTWGVTSGYSPQTVYSIIPATATHGSNVVYQQSSAAVSDSVVRGDASAFYYPSPYMQMAPGSVHHISPAPSCPVPGILVQGPPPMQIFSASSHPQRDTFQSGTGPAGSNTDSMRVGHSQPAVQLYLPHAQRQ